MPTPRVPALSRRTLLTGATVLPAAALLAADPAPAGRTLRVGLIGCGGRGTGAAVQAALSDPDVRVVALADLFDDQIEASAEILAAAIGPRFERSAAARFSGRQAGFRLLDSGVDLVILAATPATRPAHLEAAVAADAHVWCETPAAIDRAGLGTVARVLAAAEDRGLLVASGLCSRFDPPTRDTVERIRAGAIGTVSSIALHHDGGLPWWRPAAAGDSAAEARQRNWIAHDELSGGAFVEHHVHALDRALWILGDDEPISAEAIDAAGTIRFGFASGATLEASCRRRGMPGGGSRERVVGSRGAADLLAATVTTPAGTWRADLPSAPLRGRMYQSAMDGLIRAIRSGAPDGGIVASGGDLLRATTLAVMGRLASGGDAVG